MSSVKDNYRDNEHASLYSKYRPVYPTTVFDKILEYLQAGSESTTYTSYIEDKRYKLAVDVGCGSGQGTLPLCQHFQSVIGLDTSEAQIEEARLRARQNHVKDQDDITFRVGNAEDLSFLADNSVDLITVATAIHWFDVERFCQECHRVLRPGGVLAAYTHGLANYFLVNGQAQEDIKEIYMAIEFNDYVDSNMQHFLDNYSQIFAVFQEIFHHARRDDSININTTWNVDGFQGLLKSYSTYRKWRMARPDMSDPVDAIGDRLLQLYNNNPPQQAVIDNRDVFILMAKK